jgi:hypothetical protein
MDLAQRGACTLDRAACEAELGFVRECEAWLRATSRKIMVPQAVIYTRNQRSRHQSEAQLQRHADERAAKREK